ncbi:hypothetical protein [Alkalicoccus daliensis]|uniref:Uncharacterized protein n=1 Tax=Alkalicoccus daliensis TaxID=745820 RepID=A0A1H0D3U2_9BACI|nr:hypothetical protein [Alkalicoccus daliensis]SDN64756.1 hypothetical protein SAMN04488053_102333 [Alkalicoccus daliensis]
MASKLRNQQKRSPDKKYFVQGMHYTMVHEFSLSDEKSHELMALYIDKIDFYNQSVQHLGSSYFVE